MQRSIHLIYLRSSTSTSWWTSSWSTWVRYSRPGGTPGIVAGIGIHWTTGCCTGWAETHKKLQSRSQGGADNLATFLRRPTSGAEYRYCNESICIPVCLSATDLRNQMFTFGACCNTLYVNIICYRLQFRFCERRRVCFGQIDRTESSSGVTSHRQPRQRRGPRGPKQ